MIYKFRLITNESEDFFRDIEIKDDQTFLDFHKAIQFVCKYDASQMSSFFTTDEEWSKGEEITLVDMEAGEGEGAEKHIMEESVLKDFISEKKERLLYVFDFFSERAFFIELMDIVEEDPDISYPTCTNAKEKAPEQIKVEEADMDDLFTDEFNDDDDKDLFDDDEQTFESLDDYEEFM